MRNLLLDAWLPCRLRDGRTKVLPIASIVDPMLDVVDVDVPREDFKSATYQLLVALLQTVFSPADVDEWEDGWLAPPTAEVLQIALNKIQHAFNVTGPGPLFMQDFDPLSTIKSSPVSGLLIEAPGENTIKKNTDHFIKRGGGEVMSLAMANLALWTLQINAPGGGAGHRVGLRGGGPLTVLVMPGNGDASLWQKLWLNVINREHWVYDDPDLHSPSVFPWLGPTKTSEKKGTEVYQHEVHPLQMYWSMPRRIRLQVEETPAACAISGRKSDLSVRFYRTQNYGINYSGDWDHPLTPYRWDPNKPEAGALSLKGQPGGLSYKVWDVLTLSSNQLGQRCSRNVEHYYQIHAALDDGVHPHLWVSGFDLDNMKARGWHSAAMPLFAVSADKQDLVLSAIKEIQGLANNALYQCRSKIKTAWFDRPAEAKGDMSFVDARFWQLTENGYYSIVQSIFNSDTFSLATEEARRWLTVLRDVSHRIFDEYAFTDLGDLRSMEKRAVARGYLTGWLLGGKEVKGFMSAYGIKPIKQQVGGVNG